MSQNSNEGGMGLLFLITFGSTVVGFWGVEVESLTNVTAVDVVFGLIKYWPNASQNRTQCLPFHICKK